MRTRIYMGIDGVINATPLSSEKDLDLEGLTGLTDWRSARVLSYPFLWSEEGLEMLRKRSQEGVDFVWTSSWGVEGSRAVAGVLGLPTGHSAISPSRRTDWRLTGVQRDVKIDPADRIVWVDDEITSIPGATEWATERNVELIIPNTSTGLTKAEYMLL